MSLYLGGDAVSGSKLKATVLWSSADLSDNSSGFTALPGGFRATTGLFLYIGDGGYFWDDFVYNNDGQGFRLASVIQEILRGSGDDKRAGWSVRCIADPVNSLPNENILDMPIQIFPNPTANKLFIETNGLSVIQVNIYNAVGYLVSQSNELQRKNIDISQLAMGVYIAEIKTKQVSVKRRWVKM